MKYYFDIEQRTTEWFAMKWGKVGGTKAKELFISSDTLFYKILAQHIEEFDEDADEGYASYAMERGNELEPIALEELSRYTGHNFIPIGWIQSDHELLGISPDGITEDCTIQAEIKCPQAINHLKMVIADEIPIEYVNQCVHAFTVNSKLEKLYFCSYRPENELKPMFVKEVNRDSMVNNGTEKRPNMELVSDLVARSIVEADKLHEQIKSTIDSLKF
jgi:predicted phage-related endonuclease